ncbi:MAG TPA: molybdopterin cofactor-binding domain-containing protein, partial [Candidatus Binatia bacterium]|nr:molybdopterin cofactor-binding domain-containing protein [Candidatus Binatia bacterium]
MRAALSRRSLLKAGAAGGLAAGFLLGFRLPLARAAGEFEPNAFIRIAGDGGITLIMPQVEMGQGTYTSISMILAEELDADFARVAVEHAPPSDKLYGNPF